MIKTYKTLPVVIEAVQLTEDSVEFLREWAGLFVNAPEKPKYAVRTLEGIMQAQIGDYIIKGLRGEFYPCKEDVFLKKYAEISIEREN